MKCTNCGKELEDGLEFCYFCGTSFGDDEENTKEQENDNTDLVNEPERQKEFSKKEQTEPETLYNTESIYAEDSTIGKAIKVLSIIILVLSVLGSFIMMSESFAIGLAVLLVSVLTSLLAYGIGEIVCLLTSINYHLR